jgi:hypothetical protein
MGRIVRLTEQDLARIVKRVIREQEETSGWENVKKQLINYESPKVINFTYEGKPTTSLNWGMHSRRGKDNWGLSISSDDGIKFQTTDEVQSLLFKSITKNKSMVNYNNRWSTDFDLNYTDSKIVPMIKNLIDVLGGKKG